MISTSAGPSHRWPVRYCTHCRLFCLYFLTALATPPLRPDRSSFSRRKGGRRRQTEKSRSPRKIIYLHDASELFSFHLWRTRDAGRSTLKRVLSGHGGSAARRWRRRKALSLSSSWQCWLTTINLASQQTSSLKGGVAFIIDSFYVRTFVWDVLSFAGDQLQLEVRKQIQLLPVPGGFCQLITLRRTMNPYKKLKVLQLTFKRMVLRRTKALETRHHFQVCSKMAISVSFTSWRVS